MNFYLVGFYYLNTEVMIPKLLARQKWFWYFLAIVVCLLLYVQIPRLFDDWIRAELPARGKLRHFRKRSIIPYPFTGTTAVFFLVFTVSTCIKVIQQWLGAEKNKQEIENEKLNTELSFLKSQINPHFLFNTLNNIYSLAIIKSEATAGAVMKLSSIMRYVISDTKQHWVPLEKELLFIQHYIDLQKVRLTEKVKINFTVNGDVANKQIAPLIFIPFVENAFKYGISTKENSEIIINVEVQGNEIKLTVENPIVTIEKELEENTGIGLKNTKRRLVLLYPDAHKLEVKKENKHFKVNLTLIK
jgi:LytS/YehU family sensor histidine kinase